MKNKKNKKTIDYELIKQQQFSKYSSFSIPKKVLIENFEIAKNIKDENELIFNFNKRIDKFIINQITNDNIDLQLQIIEYYSYIKKMIIKNSKYNVEDINKIYDDAIELLKDRYDENELLSINILNNMKYIILSNNKQNKSEEEYYDISFFKEYIELYFIDQNIYANILEYDSKTFKTILDGQKGIKKDDLYLLCNLFNANNYDDLKEVIEEKIQFQKEKEKAKELLLKKRQELLEKNKKETIIKNEEKTIKKEIDTNNGYNISFLKEYVNLYNLSEKELSKKLHCGVGKIQAILDGKLLIKENIIEEIAYEFNANDYDDLYNKIMKKIEIKKENINNMNVKVLKK